eukprot:12555063-Ditylum_brightwellii.AAC.1
MALNAIASEQEHPTQKTVAAIVQLLNYCATHPEATVQYHASGMVLHIHIDASLWVYTLDGALVGVVVNKIKEK